MTMLSNPTSAIETRRKAHRRQNSTPNIEVGAIRKQPAATSGLQRANSNRHLGHRRGLSLDQPHSVSYQKLTPTLGPIAHDDISVSNHWTPSTNQAGLLLLQEQQQQYRETAVAQPSLAQPGQHQFQGMQPIQTQNFSIGNQSPLEQQFDHSSPHHASAPQLPYTAQPPVQQAPITPASQNQSVPTLQQINDLENHIKSVYGAFGDVYINILPTPVTTPQKRASIVPLDNIDVSPIPLTFDPSDVHLDPTAANQDFKLNLQSPESERGYDSSFYSSPSHSINCSPQQLSVKTFVSDLQNHQFSLGDDGLFSSQTTLVDVEPFIATSGSASPSRSPRAVSIADLNIDGTIEDTGISAEEVAAFISSQDPVTHRWRCLYPGCQSKTFGRRENIRSHVQTHLGDRQYRCNHCSKCFVRQHDLKRHAKIHSGNKPYKCPCGNGFARQDALTRHRQRGMCVGGFPNAVRKQARRGRPRKPRPGMDERLEKAMRSRDRENSSSGSAGSGAEDSPSPPYQPDISAIDTSRLMDLPEEDTIDDLNIDPSFAAHSSPASHESYSSPFELENTHDNIFHLSADNLAETPPASPPPMPLSSSSSMPSDMGKNHLANSPHDSITSPTLPRTPPPASASSSSLSFNTTPPTSPLCGPAASPSPPPLMSSSATHGDLCSSSLFDELGISTCDDSIGGGSAATAAAIAATSEAMGITFASSDPTLASLGYSSLEYLKNPEMCNITFGEPDDDSFRMWGLEGSDF